MEYRMLTPTKPSPYGQQNPAYANNGKNFIYPICLDCHIKKKIKRPLIICFTKERKSCLICGELALGILSSGEIKNVSNPERTTTDR
jgi:hypothetical protein